MTLYREGVWEYDGPAPPPSSSDIVTTQETTNITADDTFLEHLEII